MARRRGPRLALIVAGATVAYYGLTAVFERLAPVRTVRAYQRFVNRLQEPAAGVVPGWAVIETVGRRTGRPRRVPVGGRLRGDRYWLVAGDGHRSAYVLNIAAEPRVRLRVHGRWRTGTAHLLPDDDARGRLFRLNPANSLFVLLASRPGDRLTVRIDLDPQHGGRTSG